MKGKAERRFLGVREISEILGISLQGAYNLVLAELPYIKCGRIYRIKAEAFEAWLKKNERDHAARR